MVTAQTSAPSLLADYQLRLPAFEGPLDVLLRLIERNQLTITDISLALVTDQFLSYVTAMSDAPPDVVAEFVAMGARLTVLKSRALLPRPSVAEEEPEPSDLVRQLTRYRQLQAVALELRTKHVAGANCYAADQRSARGVFESPVVRLAHYEASTLRRSLRRRLASLPRPREVLNQRRIVSLREMIDRLLSIPRRSAPHTFTHIISECETRAEMSVAFLALLVLVRRGSMEATQEVRFGEITLRLAPAETRPIGYGTDESEAVRSSGEQMR
jgi:segregation and condensation protein A